MKMSKRFKDWFEDGNVEEIDGGYTTQDSQWTNRIKDMPSLYAYWLKEFGCAIILLMMLTSCAKEPLEFSYDSFRELRTYDLSLNQLLRDGTEDWVENNMSDLKPYQTEFFNKVLVPSLAEEIKWGLPLEVMTAQAILESGWGQSALAKDYNNYFGIKEYRKDMGGVRYYSDEYEDGKRVSRKSRFRTYANAGVCFADRSEWFLANSRYEDLDFRDLDCYEFAKELQNRGYATDINYTRNLIRIIEQYKLNEYAAWIKRTI